jgi:hypothetical protein
MCGDAVIIHVLLTVIVDNVECQRSEQEPSLIYVGGSWIPPAAANLRHTELLTETRRGS